MTALDLLLTVRAILADRNAFLDGLDYARDIDGFSVDTEDVRAVRWSAPGALRALTFRNGQVLPEYAAALAGAREAIHAVVPSILRGPVPEVSTFHLMTQKHAFVLQILDQAIARLSAAAVAM